MLISGRMDGDPAAPVEDIERLGPVVVGQMADYFISEKYGRVLGVEIALPIGGSESIKSRPNAGI